MQLPGSQTQRAGLDETDQDIVAALHVAPRVPTAALAEILDIPQSTVSRRLTRLQDERLVRVAGRYAWELITSSNPFEVWITSAPGKSNAVLKKLLEIPDVQAVLRMSGPADLYAHLYPLKGSDHVDLLERVVPSIPGVRAIDSRMILDSVKVGQAWRFARLRGDQIAALETHRAVVSEPAVEDLGRLTDLEFHTMDELGANGRVTAAEVGRKLGVSSSTAARAIRALLASGAVAPRVELQPALVGYPLDAALSLDVAPRDIRETLSRLAEHPSVRIVSTVTGAAPISVGGSFSGPKQLARFLQEDLGALPGLRSVSSVAGLSLERRYWIDRDGLRLGERVEGVLRR